MTDAGYGNLNNYLYCQEHGMEKYMKFPMYEKETKDKKYRDDPFGDCPDKLRFYLHKYHLSKLAKANPVKAAG